MTQEVIICDAIAIVWPPLTYASHICQGVRCETAVRLTDYPEIYRAECESDVRK